MKKIPVIIPHFRHADRLEKCKTHLLAQEGVEVQIYVRDNNEDNILFTAAINEGLRQFCYTAEHDYVLILNQDAYLEPDVLRTLVAFMDATPGCGIASPVHVAADHKTVTWGGSTRAFPFGEHHCAPLETYTTPFKIHWANGAFMLIRTETVRDAGLFDKNMRFICSDADFSFSARLRGWHIYVVPGPLCEHDIGSSNEGAEDALTLIKLRDAQYFGQKWLDGNLYRQMAWEGEALSTQFVQQEMATRRQEIAFIENRLATAQR
jgi:GT2 family glycosyltransferase